MMATYEERKAELSSRLDEVSRRITRAAESVGRDPKDIELLPVTKFHPYEDLQALADCGVTVVGENREQEARDKARRLGENGVGLHIDMIGQVQSKKTNHIARWAHRVHTVDRLKIVHGLDNGIKRAVDAGERVSTEHENVDQLPVFIQWSADGDPSRGGAKEDDLDSLADAINSSQYLTLEGLMVVPPRDDDSAEVFARAAELSEAIRQKYGGCGGLSAGMSGDLENAIATGSTVVRVGTAILGSRPVTL